MTVRALPARLAGSVARTTLALPRAAFPVTARYTSPLMSLAPRFYSSAAALTPEIIQERIFEVLRDFAKVPQDKLSPNADFSKDLGLDSLDIVEVVMAIEEEFTIEIPDKQADEIRTVDQAVQYISHAEGAI
ncbi:acyl carrier protein [Dimargaris cristalligena]|uniref:Acyl carrier protein n=1 Tax=Dimargaris cristalligena TaxID=215637 RepID=A0A4Q0A2M0_9FUNG|nr:acyl carrier protein [Dimargaris cristalligena]|eukprot:RKP40317.1 acyl carrier protein [Dimargaris cristalligena]